ncbi:uncharacterized protein CFP56_027862 [Quercus suber]|uniref:NAD-dependent epimerase/dehydratase domain-containing protein n=1 Tax=Quercus suber TaxID=58331 RepID=A0AAW0LWE1_QUESU
MASFSPFSAISSAPTSLTTLRTRPPTSHFRNRIGVRCSYAEAATIRDDFKSATIDVVADIKTERVVVLGGSGFVGSAICKAAVSKGIEVISLSRASYLPKFMGGSGDVFYVNWDEVLAGATAVVSTLGGFGSEEQMLRINGRLMLCQLMLQRIMGNSQKKRERGELHIDIESIMLGEISSLMFSLFLLAGIPKFILISVHDYNLPSFILSTGYFTGKRKAEAEVLSKYPNSGVVLRPGFIYGKRRVDGFEIPLDLIGEPVERILRATESFTRPLSSLPASDLLLAPPVSVDDVALAAINAVSDDDFFGIFTIEQIKEAAEKVRAEKVRV